MASKKSKNMKGSKFRQLIVIGIVILAYVIFDLSPFGGNIRFYAKWVECGQKPVATAGSGYLNSGAIHYFYSPDIAFSRPSIEYFCTPLEAEKAGFSANPNRYEFPHLHQN